MEEISLKAYAKINLGLDIVGKREDGYHLLKSVMQQVDLYDVICVKKISNGIILKSESPYVPLDETNIAYKCAKLMMDKYEVKGGVEINIDKRIPVAAGMAGGSTDGAAVLKAVNELYELNLSIDELCEMGVKVGADVPFCIRGGAMLCEGIGEVMTPVNSIEGMYVLIAKPGLSVSTVHVYKSLKLNEVTHPDMDKVLSALENNSIKDVADNIGNVLESVTAGEYEIINELKVSMKEKGALGSLMSGSGPTVFGIYDDKNAALKAQDEISAKYPDIFVKAVGIVR